MTTERSLTAGVKAEVVKAEVTPILLVEANFYNASDSPPSSFVRLWSGTGGLSWNGYTWTGAGQLLSVQEIVETADLKATGISVELTGLTTEMVSIALGSQYQGRGMVIWLGFLDPSGAVVADPFQIFGGRMDIMSIQEDADIATISVTAENQLVDLTRSRERRYTKGDQNRDHPSDTGFDHVESIQDAEIAWGRG